KGLARDADVGYALGRCEDLARGVLAIDAPYGPPRGVHGHLDRKNGLHSSPLSVRTARSIASTDASVYIVRGARSMASVRCPSASRMRSRSAACDSNSPLSSTARVARPIMRSARLASWSIE